MQIGIIGAGNMGSAFARRLSAAGHDVSIASRELEDARAVSEAIGTNVQAVPQEQLAGKSDILIAATPFDQQANALRHTGNLDGKVVIEISNPMKEDMSGLAVGLTTSAAEEIAKAVPGARVVKAFNTVFAQLLGDEDVRDAGVQVFYAGDDETATESVRSLIESAGFQPVNAGPLANARYLEPIGMLNIYFGYVAKLGLDIAPALQRVSPQEESSQAARTKRSTTAVRDSEHEVSRRPADERRQA